MAAIASPERTACMALVISPERSATLTPGAEAIACT